MLGGPSLGEPAAEWQRRERSPGAEKRGAPALLDAVQEQFPVASLSEPCMTVPNEVGSQRCTGQF